MRERAERARARWRARSRWCAIVALSLFVVLMAADRPSVLSPTTHAGFFPHWMAGPLGGLLAGADATTARRCKYLFTGAIVVMYVALHGARCATRRGCRRAG